MRHAILAGLALMVAACSRGGEAPPVAEPVEDRMFGTAGQLSPSEPGTTLRYADHPRGFAELRLPAGEGPFPLALIFHGGCWRTGIADQRYMAPLATRWQGQGIATLNVDYREVGDGGGWPGSFVDWQAAAALIDRAAAEHPIDRERVTLVGHSAGALPALWLASPRGPASPVGEALPVYARAAIVLDGPADVGLERAAFDELCQFAAVEPFLGTDPARAAAISPRNAAPLLEEVLFVTARLPAPPATALDGVRGDGAQVAVRENAGASHFAIITPGDPAYAANETAMLAVLRGE